MTSRIKIGLIKNDFSCVVLFMTVKMQKLVSSFVLVDIFIKNAQQDVWNRNENKLLQKNTFLMRRCWLICKIYVTRNGNVENDLYFGSSINDVTVLRGRGQGFCDSITKNLFIKSVTIGGGSKIIKYCVTSFMDDPFLLFISATTRLQILN